jgi:RNA polymerase sigma-70 factor (ECF subfamily)
MSAHNEKKLLILVAEGDENAFAQLFYLYHQRLGAYIYQITCSREMTEEIVQDVFLKTWMLRQTLATVESFQSWLFVVAKNHAINGLKKSVSERRRQEVWKKSIQEEPVLQDIEAEDKYQLLDEAIGQLPQQQRKVFIMSRYHRLKYEEIASELNLSRETVKYYLQIATSSISKFIIKRIHLVLWMLLINR